MSGFLYRDIVKFIIPTLIGVCLFSPLLGIDLKDNSIVLISIFIGFLFSGILGRINFLGILPAFKKKQGIADMMNSNWDYDLMFYSLDKDERDYLYLSGAYLQFYRSTTIYLVMYLAVSFYNLINNSIIQGKFSPENFLQIKNSIIGGIEINTIVVFSVILISLIFLIKHFLLEYELLFFPSGQYDTLAKRMQLTNDKIVLSKSIWGRIIKYDKGLVGNTVKLRVNGIIEESCQTNSYGYFQFKNMFDKYKTKNNLSIETTISNITKSNPVSLSDNTIPYYEIEF